MINTRIFKNLQSNLRAGMAFGPRIRSASPSRTVPGFRPSKGGLHYARESEQRSHSANSRSPCRSQNSEFRIQNSGVRSQEPVESCSGHLRFWPGSSRDPTLRPDTGGSLCYIGFPERGEMCEKLFHGDPRTRRDHASNSM
jgi:hypothetical protein